MATIIMEEVAVEVAAAEVEAMAPMDTEEATILTPAVTEEDITEAEGRRPFSCVISSKLILSKYFSGEVL